MAEIIEIPAAYRPTIDELPGDLSRIAAAIEEHIPGDGVRLTLLLAQVFGGTPVYFRRVDRFVRPIRDDAMRARYDQGDVSMKEIALLFGVSLSTAERVLARPSSPAAQQQEKQGKLFGGSRE